jgi:hypothetical protein
MLAIDRRARLALLVLVDDRDELPGADDLLLELGVIGTSRIGDERQQAEQQDSHLFPPPGVAELRSQWRFPPS